MDNLTPQTEEFAAAEAEQTAAAGEHGEHLARMDWKQHLISLRQTARATLDRLLEYLQRWRPTSSDAAVPSELNHYLAATLESLSARQDSLESLLHSLGSSADSSDHSAIPPAWAVELQAIVANRLDAFESALQESRPPLAKTESQNESPPDCEPLQDTVIFSAADFPSVPAPASALVRSSGSGWLEKLLGPTLYGDPKLAGSVEWLENSALDENPAALLLLGQLLVFRFSGADRKPTVLKDLGEAFYRCFPKTRADAASFEAALCTWLKRLCEEAGLANSVEVVHVGDRFDMSRHSPIEKGGVEVTDVFGWVVLREGGRVFSKASVQTR